MATNLTAAQKAMETSIDSILSAIRHRTYRHPGATTITLKYHLRKTIKDALVAQGFKVVNKSRTKTEFDGTTKVLGKKTLISW